MTTVMPETGVEQDVIVTEKTQPVDGNKGGSGKRHVIMGRLNPPLNLHIWKPGMEGQDIVDIARVRGLEIEALCGFKWVPSGRDPKGMETCDACLEEMARIMNAGE